jgi:hypothetical protein
MESLLLHLGSQLIYLIHELPFLITHSSQFPLSASLGLPPYVTRLPATPVMPSFNGRHHGRANNRCWLIALTSEQLGRFSFVEGARRSPRYPCRMLRNLGLCTVKWRRLSKFMLQQLIETLHLLVSGRPMRIKSDAFQKRFHAGFDPSASCFHSPGIANEFQFLDIVTHPPCDAVEQEICFRGIVIVVFPWIFVKSPVCVELKEISKPCLIIE